MDLNKSLIKFLKENKALIATGQMDTLYDIAYNSVDDPALFIGTMTDAFIDSGIDIASMFKNKLPAYFACASNMKSFIVPEGIETIGRYAFAYCRKLEHIQLPRSLKTIHPAAFKDCMMLDIDLSKTSIGKLWDSCFDSCNFTNIELPDTCFEIGDGAFYDCTELQSIYIPDSVIKFGDYIFGGDNRNEQFTIECKRGSAAQRYAKENGFDYYLR